MKLISSGTGMKLGTGALLMCTLLLSCKNLPEPAFSITPGENPEAGELITFNNESVDAISFEWEFGDGGTSLLENPEYMYQAMGSYQVSLTAINEDGEKQLLKLIAIHNPTVLGFQIFDSTGLNLLPAADVWIYDNEDDLLNLREPLYADVSDDKGEVRFENLEAQIYYFLAIKSAEGGTWLFAYSTPVLEQNEENYFRFNCLWFPNETKSASVDWANFNLDLEEFQGHPLKKYSHFHD